jgi:hypothetical protein
MRPDCLTLKGFVALAIVATALLYPLQPAVAVGRLVGFVLIKTRIKSSLACGLVGILCIDALGKHCT